MSNQSPYAAPKATINDAQNLELYQPMVFSLTGRLGRLRYLAYNLGINAALFLVLIVISYLFLWNSREPFGIFTPALLGWIFYFAIIINGIIFSTRRLNDLNLSGWYSLFYILTFIPRLYSEFTGPIVFSGIVFMIFLVFTKGNMNSNDYGATPPQNSLFVKILGIGLPVLLITFIIWIFSLS